MSIIGDLTAYIAQLEQRLARLEIVEYNNTAAVSFGNPTASLGLTAINGVATTAMRSDAAPALNVGIAPTWTAVHKWNLNAAALPATLAGTILQIGNADGTNSRLLIDSFGSATSQGIFRRARTTALNPSALLANDQIGGFAGFGYGATGYSATSRAQFNFFAAENWSDTAQGTYIQFNTTPKLSTTSAAVMRIDDAGNISTLLGKITQYNNIATAGYGVPAIVDIVSLTNQNATIADTAFVNTNVAGLYRVQIYVEITTADASGASVQVTIKWTDDGAARSTASTLVAFNTTNFANRIPNGTSMDTVFIRLNSGSITWGTSVSAGPPTTGKYALYATCERLN